MSVRRFVASCVMWTKKYRKRVILKLSQPKFLLYLCGGCVVSTLSSAAPLLGENTLACQLSLWLYGCGFVITTATLYIKMQQMNNVIEHSLQMTSKKIKTNNFQIFKVLIFMAAGEFVILAVWSIAAPLQFKRSCLEDMRVEGGVWDGVCTDSLGKCRTTAGELFVALLCFYHACCVLAGMYMCYLVRNLPSIIAAGKWVSTGFYSQL